MSDAEVTPEVRPEDKPLEYEITPIVNANRVSIKVPNEELRQAFDAYWDEYGEVITKKSGYKGKKLSNGGVRGAQKALEGNWGFPKLYTDVLVDYINHVLEDEGPVISIEGLDLHEVENADYSEIVSTLYFLPKFKMDEPINYEVPWSDHLKRDEAANWQSVYSSLRERHGKAIPASEGTKIDSDSRVVLNVVTSCEGKMLDVECYKNKEVRPKNMPNIGLRDSLIGHVKGDGYETTYMVGDKSCMSQVQILDVLATEYLSDEELAKAEKYESFEAMKEARIKLYNESMDRQEENWIADKVVNNIALSARSELFPSSYISHKIDEHVERIKDQVKGDELKLLRETGMKDMKELRKALKGNVMRDLYRDMALRYYANTNNIDLTDNVELGKHLRANVKWTGKE